MLNLATFRPVACLLAISAFLIPPPGPQPADVPRYAVFGTLPDVFDGRPMQTLAFDFMANRLYAGSRVGLFWSDLTDPTPRWKGPLVRNDIFKVEVAPDLGRVFYAAADEVGYVDVRNGGAPVRLIKMLARDLAYEPTRQELYVASRMPNIMVFEARTGERGADIPLPGWAGFGLEPVPGRVFLEVAGHDGLYAIDAATHKAERWPVNGHFYTPAVIEADPSGRSLFVASNREIVAIDVATAKVTGKVFTETMPSIGFDRGTGLLLATWWDSANPEVNIAAFRAGADGLTSVVHMRNPSIGMVGVMEPTSHGFIQRGVHALLMWSSERAAAGR